MSVIQAIVNDSETAVKDILSTFKKHESEITSFLMDGMGLLQAIESHGVTAAPTQEVTPETPTVNAGGATVLHDVTNPTADVPPPSTPVADVSEHPTTVEATAPATVSQNNDRLSHLESTVGDLVKVIEGLLNKGV